MDAKGWAPGFEGYKFWKTLIKIIQSYYTILVLYHIANVWGQFVKHPGLTLEGQQSVTQSITMIVMNLVTPKALAES